MRVLYGGSHGHAEEAGDAIQGAGCCRRWALASRSPGRQGPAGPGRPGRMQPSARIQVEVNAPENAPDSDVATRTDIVGQSYASKLGLDCIHS